MIFNIQPITYLLTITINRDVLTFERLNNEIAHHATIVRMHTGAIGVENAHHFDFKLMLAPIIEEERFGAAFALIIATANADGVHAPPIVFRLGVHFGVAIDFAR